MKQFMDKDFLLETEPAKVLFHQYAENMPIFDYHCHLIPKEVAENKREKSITSAWLYGDHYKWRQMRTNGIDEREGDDFEKFCHWADTVAHLVGNPLYHWTHLELQRFFGITKPLSLATAKEIYEEANEKLATDPSLDAWGIFKKFNVYAVGTTDDPADSLEYHVKAKADGCPAKVVPSFRPDKAVKIGAEGFAAYIEKLSKAAKVTITSASDVLAALCNRLDFFIANGCLATDHGLEAIPYAPATDEQVNSIFKKRMKGESVSALEDEQYRTYIMLGLGKLYAERNIVMQLHLNALRDNCTRGFKLLGPDTGYDSVADYSCAEKLSRFLDTLDVCDKLPKTILYSLNPNDYYPMGTLMGCFQKDIPGKIQLGSAWWFCDHRDGMEQQIKVLGNLGSLSRFVGMLTDSRSFLSYPRHEYFRRILCNVVGGWMENGEIPSDYEMIGKMISDISFTNAQNYFKR